MDRLQRTKETFSYAKNRAAGNLAIGVLALSTIACKATDIFASPDPLASFARGTVGTALLATEIFGLKPVNNALFKETNAGKAFGCLATTIILPLAGGALAVAEPTAGYVLFYAPLTVGALYALGRGKGNSAGNEKGEK